MSKRFDSRLLATAILMPAVVAGCATPLATSPVPDTTSQGYSVQGGVEGQSGMSSGEHGAPAQVPASAADGVLHNLAYVTSHPILDYSAYENRGNFVGSVWGPSMYGGYRYYRSSHGYMPYSYGSDCDCYTPATVSYYGRTAYPYIGYGGYPYLSYASPYFYGYGGLGYYGGRYYRRGSYYRGDRDGRGGRGRR